MPSDHVELDELIEQTTVDAYGDEGFTAFTQAFDDDANLPTTATLAGIEVTVHTVDFDGNEHRGLTARIRRDGPSQRVSVLDLAFPGGHAAQFTAAYRRWLGIT